MNKQVALFTLILIVLISSIAFFIYRSRHPKIENVSSNFKFRNEYNNDDDTRFMWEKYQKQFRIEFDDPVTEEYRYNIFKQNLIYIDGKKGLSITQYMHLTQQEFAEFSFGVNEEEPESTKFLQDISFTTRIIDWNSYGSISTIKNQGLCQSSWAFAVVAGFESALFIKKGKYTYLSEQVLLDCDEQNDGCKGGDREQALQFVMKKGLNTLQEYPYKAFDSYCKLDEEQAYKIQSYKTMDNCDDILNALQDGPIIVSIDGSDLQFYNKGIIQTGYKQRNFGALLVGFDSEKGYWKLKTSLSTKFGEKGYLRLSAVIKNGQIENTAGICDQAFQIQVREIENNQITLHQRKYNILN